MSRTRIKLGQMLLDAGVIDEFQLNSALSHQRNCGEGRIGTSLVKLKYILEDQLLDLLSEQLGLPRVDLPRRRVPADVLAYIPAEKAWQYKAIPIDRKEIKGALYLLVAMGDPTDLAALEALQVLTGCRIRPALAFESAIVESLVNHYGPLVSEEQELVIDTSETAEIDFPGLAPRNRSARTEEKFQQLLKILLDKGILSLREFERLK